MGRDLSLISILPIIGSAVVISLALAAAAFQGWLFIRSQEKRFHGWGTALSLVTAVFCLTSFVQYCQPGDEIAIYSERIQYSTFPLMVFCLYGFSFSFFKLRPQKVTTILGAATLLMVAMVWIPDLILTDILDTKNIHYRLTAYKEPRTGPLGIPFIAICYLAALCTNITWLKRLKTEKCRTIPYLVGFAIWTLTALHDALATFGMPTYIYLMSYGVLGFNIAVVWTTTEDYLVLRKKLEEHQLDLENMIERRTATLEQTNRELKRSIEEIKIMEEERNALEDQLRQSQKLESIGMLAGGIAHEFNNMLGIIIGNNELALEDLPDWSPVKRNLQEIQIAGKRSREVVKQLLTFSRKDRGQRTPMDIGPAVMEALQLMRSSIPRNIRIDLQIPNQAYFVNANATHIHQLVMNICGNAADAMLENGGTLSVTMNRIDGAQAQETHPPLSATHQFVKVAISDNGTGMEKSTLERIFDPFYTTKEVNKGTGMGLAVVHGIVEQHQGLITVTSEAGQGSCFTIYLPLYDGPLKPPPPVTSQALPTGSECVLIVDDEAAILDISKQQLERLGYRVKTAASPLNALNHFQASPEQFDLVITDMAMPHMTGAQLARRLMEIRPDLPIILCTGYSEQISPAKAHFEGIRAFLMKPLDKTKLAQTVRRVLDEEQVAN